MDLLRDSSKSGNGRLHSVSFILVETGYLDNIINIQLKIKHHYLGQGLGSEFTNFSGTVLCKNIRESGDGQHKIVIIIIESNNNNNNNNNNVLFFFGNSIKCMPN